MFDGAFDVRFLLVRAEHLRDHLLSGERGEGERADELLRVRRHDDLNLQAVLLQFANQLSGLICRDAATYSDRYFHKIRRLSAPSPRQSINKSTHTPGCMN